MAIERMSRTTLTRSELRNWDHYASPLGRDPQVAALVGERLRSWVQDENLSNPLAIDWVYRLWNDQLYYVRADLNSWLGNSAYSGVLAEMLGELGQYRSPAQAEQKIESLRCEAATFRILKPSFPYIERSHSGGDWLIGSRDISVKSKLPLELTYRIVDHALHAWQAIAENVHARHISRICLIRLDAADHASLERILGFIDHDLEKVVALWVDGGCRTGEIPGECQFVQMNAGRLYVSVRSPASEAKPIGELTLEAKTSASELVSISYDKNAWFYEKIDGRWLALRLTEPLREIQEANARADHVIEGWLNLLIHPRNAEWVRDNIDEVRRTAADVTMEYEFPASVCLFPEWSYVLASPIIWAFRGGIGQELPTQVVS
jgi:hypothetical protein